VNTEESAPRAAERQLYERYTPLVRRIAMKAIRSLPSSVTFDDLLSAGWVGLAEALRRRTATMDEEQFEAYASHRVLGSILDHLRSLDPLSRKLRGASRRITEVAAELERRLGRAPGEDEISAELSMPLEQYHELLTKIADAGLARLELTESIQDQGVMNSPELMTSQRELVEQVTIAIDTLPERLQEVLGLHYQEDCSFREIGAILGVTESRACQLHAEAVHRIRAKLMAPGLRSPAVEVRPL
jgi:RNA polymerase sigma factor for flagellar operon FliA